MAASKLKQILQLEPANEISFQGPFEQVVTSYLELKNPTTDRRLCFKVKTTAPKRYCVRPNSGIVEPDGKIKIAIMLQPLDPDSEAEARTKHKFMVQSTIVKSGDENIPLDELWQNTKPELIMDSKLRCVFHSSDQQDGDIEPMLAGSKQQQQQRRQQSELGSIPDVAAKSVSAVIGSGTTIPPLATALTTKTGAPAATATTTQQVEQLHARKQRASDVDGQQPELVSTSTPVSSRFTASNTKPWGTSPRSTSSNQNLKRSDEHQRAADKSIASSHNLTSSFMQPMSDDYKIAVVSLIMLVLGVILGKYII